ncbi:MAG TPA: histidine kinase [Gaiellaceae bacterium]|nr:histidine kinase [Gaiellaceae bacterium]
MATRAAPAVHDASSARAVDVSVVLLLFVGAFAATVAVLSAWSSPLIQSPHTTALVRGSLVAAYIGVGAYTWWRQPARRLGALIAAAGLLYSMTSLANSQQSLPFTIGRLALAVLAVYFGYLFLCFPHDRLVTVAERRLLATLAATSAVVWAIVLALAHDLPHGGAFSDCIKSCPDNAFQVVSTSEPVSDALGYIANGITAFLVLVVAAVLVRRLRAPSRLRRRAVAPLLGAAILFGVSYAAYSLASQLGVDSSFAALRVVSAIGAFGIALALLIGQFRGRIFAATNLWQIVAASQNRRVTPSWVEEVLGKALGDPSFRLGLWDPERRRFVDAHGEPLDLAGVDPASSVTRIEHDGHASMALIHDSSLEDEPEIVQGLGVTAVMLLENAQLVDQLRSSRARIVDSAERERLRLERDLHDGAQQRLMAIELKLAAAREHAGAGELANELDEVAEEASTAVQELRELAHGVYPALLRERGLGDALRGASSASPLPVEVVDRECGRAPASTEAAVYYCCLEAIQNAGKHAGRARVRLTLSRRPGHLDFEVADDGAGFDLARHADGDGLLNMRDRIGAVGGTLDVESLAGEGTTVSGSVPVAD